jgi:transposase
MKRADIVNVFGVSLTSIRAWLKAYNEGGNKALTSKKRGRKKGGSLTMLQSASIRKSVVGKNPGQLRLPGVLWTREAVSELIKKRFNKILSRWTVGRYLKNWGLTPQKPAKRAMEQNPAQVRYWLQVKYPMIVHQAKLEKAMIFWGDEMGLRSDHQCGTTWGLKGQTPVVRQSGARISCNMLSAINNRGKMSFMVYHGKFVSKVFITFLDRLIRHHDKGKVFLIVDNHSVHRSAKVREWIASHNERLCVFYLPAYSPELNPDELLNNAAKSAIGRAERASDCETLKSKLRGYLRSIQHKSKIVANFFKGKHVAYAQVQAA